MLEVNELSFQYGSHKILHDVSFRAESGRITTILGPNGCGKTTLLKILCGILSAEQGSVTLDGKNLFSLSSTDRAKEVSYLAQNRRVPDITVERLVLHGRFPYLSYPRRYRKEDYEIAERVMKQMQITEFADTPLEELSGGQRQRVYLAMALAQDTPVMLFDEPTTYLDVSHGLQMMETAHALAGQGKHVIMVLHDLSTALSCSDHIILLKNGTVLAQGDPETIYSSSALEEAFDVRVLRVPVGDHWQYYCELVHTS